MPKTPARIPVPPLTDAMYASGKRPAKDLRSFDVIQAHYDRAHDMLDLTLRGGITIRIPRLQIRELAGAQPKDLAKIEIQPGGDGLSFRKLDVDIYVPGLLADELGALFSRAMGRRTRGKTTPKKAAASRENGRKGGRPRKPSAAA